MKVLYVISSLAKCGPVNVLYDIVQPLAKENVVVVATLRAEGENSRAADFAELGVNVVRLTDSRSDYLRNGKKRLSLLLKSFQPEVVHTHGYRADVLCSGLDVPVVTTVHNNIYEDFRDTYGPMVGRFMERSQVRALRSIPYIVACSQSNADYLMRGYGLQARAIRNGVDQERFSQPSGQTKNRLRATLGMDSGHYILVSTGGCSERKRTLETIASFNRVLAGRGFELFILGGGPLLDKCREIAGEGVHVLGPQPNVVDYLRASDLFVSLSASEGMPLAVLEAISCGLPVLLSDIGPHKEIAMAIWQPGSCQIVEPAAAEIDRALTDLRENPGQGRRGTDEILQFSSSAMAADYLSLYREIAGRRSRKDKTAV